MKKIIIGLTVICCGGIIMTKCKSGTPLFDIGYQSGGTPQRIVVKNNDGDVSFIILKTDFAKGDTIQHTIILKGDSILID